MLNFENYCIRTSIFTYLSPFRIVRRCTSTIRGNHRLSTISKFSYFLPFWYGYARLYFRNTGKMEFHILATSSKIHFTLPLWERKRKLEELKAALRSAPSARGQGYSLILQRSNNRVVTETVRSSPGVDNDWGA